MTETHELDQAITVPMRKAVLRLRNQQWLHRMAFFHIFLSSAASILEKVQPHDKPNISAHYLSALFSSISNNTTTRLTSSALTDT